MSAASESTIEQFAYPFAGALHRCGYCLSGSKLLVVVGEHHATADVDGRQPERLARMLVHELLVRAAFARRCADRHPS